MRAPGCKNVAIGAKRAAVSHPPAPFWAFWGLFGTHTGPSLKNDQLWGEVLDLEDVVFLTIF